MDSKSTVEGEELAEEELGDRVDLSEKAKRMVNLEDFCRLRMRIVPQPDFHILFA